MTSPAPAVHQTSPRPGTKLARVLNALATGRSFNRFESERELHDHVLHSSVAAIERRFGLKVARHEETVPGFGGHPTRVMRYWLDPDQQTMARAIIGEARQ